MKRLLFFVAVVAAFDNHYKRTIGVITNNRRSTRISQAIQRARLAQINQRVLLRCAVGDENACIVAKLISHFLLTQNEH